MHDSNLNTLLFLWRLGEGLSLKQAIVACIGFSLLVLQLCFPIWMYTFDANPDNESKLYQVRLFWTNPPSEINQAIAHEGVVWIAFWIGVIITVGITGFILYLLEEREQL